LSNPDLTFVSTSSSVANVSLSAFRETSSAADVVRSF